MLQFLKNRIKTSRTFWRYRHLVDPDVWRSYHADHTAGRRQFYANYMRSEGLNSVFEFGCASGPNLQSIVNNIDLNPPPNIVGQPSQDIFSQQALVIAGYDINRAAVKTARTLLAADTRLFLDQLDIKKLKDFLSRHGMSSFDLAIYDRVLYLLDDVSAENHFRSVSSFLDHVIIDDFCHQGETCSNGVYFTKDYASILAAHGFGLASDEISEHPAHDPFFQTYARRQIFKKSC